MLFRSLSTSKTLGELYLSTGDDYVQNLSTNCVDKKKCRYFLSTSDGRIKNAKISENACPKIRDKVKLPLVEVLLPVKEG